VPENQRLPAVEGFCNSQGIRGKTRENKNVTGGARFTDGRAGLGLEIVEDDALEVGDDDIARDFGGAAFGLEFLDVLEGLGAGFFEGLAGAFVLG